MNNPFQGFAAIAGRFENAKISGTTARAWCPVHQGDGKSRRDNRTLSLRQAHDGSIQITCFAGCEHRAILEAVGLHYVDLLPDHMRRATHSTDRQTPEARAKFLEWQCRQNVDAVIIPINIVRIVAGRILDHQADLAAVPIAPDEWQQLRKAHHDIGEIAAKLGGRSHG